MKLNYQKILKISERISDFPKEIRYKIDQIKFYWAHFKWPSFNQWKRIGKVLTKREKIFLLTFFILFLGSLSFLITNFYLAHTHLVPARGGKYIEGIVGSPRFINPIYADFSDVDRDLTEILFSGLMKYTYDGQIIPDLAEKVEVEDGGKEIKVYLKPNIFWSNGERITADDVIFTIKIIQDPDYKSSLRTNWLGIKAEKISEDTVSFKLNKPYSAFLERLTLKIIPEHIWKDISPQNFPLSFFNLKPIGSGPYRLKDLEQDEKGFIKSAVLEPNQFYYGKKPYISEVSFLFFENEQDLIKSWGEEKIDGFSSTSFEPGQQNLLLHSFDLPRYFAVFFNLSSKTAGGEAASKILAEKKIREALSYGTDKEEIIKNILGDKAKIIHSPILPEIYGFNSPKNFYDFDLEKAKEILDNSGFKETIEGVRQRIIEKEASFQFKSKLQSGSRGKEVEELQKCLANPDVGGPEIYPEAKITGFFGPKTKAAVIKFQEKYYQDILKPWGFTSGTGIVGRTTREKLNEICAKPETKFISLKFILVTVEDPLLLSCSNLLKNQWKELGVEIEVKSYPVSQLEKERIKPRDYEMLLFGESLGIIPDPFPFWHSSQKKDPGLNLTGYKNKNADKLLEEARTNLDPKIRAKKLQEFQEILIEDLPCLFLFSPDYLYFISTEVKGVGEGVIVEPSKRFLNIENWYTKEKRVWKKT